MDSLCQCPPLAREHARFGETHDLPRQNHFQEITVGCWARVPTQSPDWTRLLEVCTCGNQCTVQPLSHREASMSPRSRSLAVRLLPAGTWVKDTSQERCSATFHLCPHTLPWALATLSNPKRRRNRGNQRTELSPSHSVMSKVGTVFVLLIVTLFASRPPCVMKDVCSAATSRCALTVCQVRTRPQTSLASWRQYRQRSGLQLCSLCPGCHLLQLSCCECLAARIHSNHWITRSCSCRVKSNRGRRVNHKKNQFSNVAAPLP